VPVKGDMMRPSKPKEAEAFQSGVAEGVRATTLSEESGSGAGESVAGTELSTAVADEEPSTTIEPSPQPDQTYTTEGATEPPAITVDAQPTDKETSPNEQEEPGVIPSDSEMPEMPDESGDEPMGSNRSTTMGEQAIEFMGASSPGAAGAAGAANAEKKVPIWMRKQT
jgi:hypothetical protein